MAEPRPSDRFTDYHVTDPKNPPAGFPKVFGQTTAWGPGLVELNLTGEPRRWQLMTDLPYDINRHKSVGFGAGSYRLGSATRTKISGWSGSIASYLGGKSKVVWVPAEPDRTATYDLTLDINQAAADAIKAFEMEHVDDIDYSWHLSFGKIGALLAQLSGTDVNQVLRQLAIQLISGDSRYLIPARPFDLGAWSKRILQVYQLMCDQSVERDNRNEHSPIGREFEVADNAIIMRVTMGPTHVGSGEYVKPEQIPLVFAAASLEEYMQNQESIHPEAGTDMLTPASGLLPPVNTNVMWRVTTAQLRENPPAGLEQGENSIYLHPALDAVSTADVNWIISTLQYSGGTAVGHDGSYVWIKLTLCEDQDDTNEPAERSRAGRELEAEEGFVRVRGSLLKPKS